MPSDSPGNRTRVPERAGLCLLAVALGLLLLARPDAPAAAPSCPPFALEKSWLVLFDGGKPSPAQRRALEDSGVVRGLPVGLWPPSGPAPLTVGLVWIAREDPTPRTVEMDADGDGVPEVVDTRDEAFGHTYQKPGNYPATIRVHEAQGEVRTFKSPVTVLTPAAFDAQLQGLWTALKDAVQRGDLAAALECVASQDRPRAEGVLRSLPRAALDKALPPIRFVEFRVVQAIYTSVRPPDWGKGPLPVPLEVRFAPDMDSVWRITRIWFKEADQ
jgi:hypothetical protein